MTVRRSNSSAVRPPFLFLDFCLPLVVRLVRSCLCVSLLSTFHFASHPAAFAAEEVRFNFKNPTPPLPAPLGSGIHGSRQPRGSGIFEIVSRESKGAGDSLFRAGDEQASSILADDLFRANLDSWQKDLLKHMLAEFEAAKAIIDTRMTQQMGVSEETRALFDRVGKDASGAAAQGRALGRSEGDRAETPEMALLAAYAGVATRGDWETPLKVLPSLLETFRADPELSALARQLLGAALVRTDRLEEALTVLEPLARDSELDEVLAPRTRVLSRLMLGDAYFFLFRYRSAYATYADAQALTDVQAVEGPLGAFGQQTDASFEPQLRLRLLWSAYRSGLYDESLEALKQVCRTDLAHWQAREPAFLAEMMRVGGAVFYEKADDRAFAELLQDPLMRTCMSGVSWAVLDKLFRVGRFAEVVETYRRHEEELLSLRSSPLLSEMAAQAADRDRPGLSPEIWAAIVENAAEPLRRGGAWESRHAASQAATDGRMRNNGQRSDELRLHAARRNFVLTSVRRAANDRYESALESGNKADSLLAAHFLAVVLEDAPEKERALLEFRRGVVLAQAGSLSAAERALRSAVSGTLPPNEEQSALETLARVLSERYQGTKNLSNLEDWTAAVDVLVSRYPGARSFVFLMSVASEWLGESPERVGVLLKSSLSWLAVASRPEDLLTTGFAQLAVRAAKNLDDLSYFEDLFRRNSAASGLAILEQAHYALAAEKYRVLRDSGLEREAVDWLGKWAKSNPQNAFRIMAYEELMNRNMRLGRFEEVYVSAREILNASSEKTGLGRVRLLFAVSAEQVKSREDAARAYVEAFQQSEAGEPARSEAALALADRFSGWMESSLEPAVRARVYDAAIASGLATFNTILRAWFDDLGASPATARARPRRSDWGEQLRRAARMDTSSPLSDPHGRLAVWLAQLSSDGFARLSPLQIADEDAVALGEECLQSVGQILDHLFREMAPGELVAAKTVPLTQALSATPAVFLSLATLKRLSAVYTALIDQTRVRLGKSGNSTEASLEELLGPVLVKSIVAHRRLRLLSQSESLETLRLLHQIVVRAGYPLSSEEAVAIFGEGVEPPLAQIPQVLLQALEGGLKHELR